LPRQIDSWRQSHIENEDPLINIIILFSELLASLTAKLSFSLFLSKALSLPLPSHLALLFPAPA